RMAIESRALWRDLEGEAGQEILITTGGLDIGSAVPLHAAALRQAGAAFEVLDPPVARRRFPVRIEDGEQVLYQPDAGIVAADRAWRAFIEGGRGAGAEVREGERVVAIRPSASLVDVETDGSTYRARACVVTAGAWARPLLTEAGIDLPVTPTRETAAYTALPDGLEIPSVVDWTSPARYALMAPGEGLKMAEHHAGPVTDPEEEGIPDPASVDRLVAWMRGRFPEAAPDPTRAETCLYTNTEDEGFILERHGPIVVGSPCSGHGFKFAPLIGERLADLAG
ncbi:MAG TPA: FAD-dependent oxidoreductase, partial [Actinomycetota bacterium]